jgi:hypothetical protein
MCRQHMPLSFLHAFPTPHSSLTLGPSQSLHSHVHFHQVFPLPPPPSPPPEPPGTPPTQILCPHSAHRERLNPQAGPLPLMLLQKLLLVLQDLGMYCLGACQVGVSCPPPQPEGAVVAVHLLPQDSPQWWLLALASPQSERAAPSYGPGWSCRRSHRCDWSVEYVPWSPLWVLSL